MTITIAIRGQVRQRANLRCEFCGVTETDIGNQLTIDHFQPKSKGGTDLLDNLIYCCVNCNLFKSDYWHIDSSTGPKSWNPRTDSASQHFLKHENGILSSLTPIGEFTINRLRLNRPLLVTYRLRQQQQAEETKLLVHYQDLTQILASLSQKFTVLLEEQQLLLKEHRKLLTMIIKKNF